MINKEPRVRLHLDPALKGLQVIAGKRIFGLLKRRLKAARGRLVTSEDGGLFFYFTTDRLPWIIMLDSTIRGHRLMVSLLAMEAYEKWKAADKLLPE